MDCEIVVGINDSTAAELANLYVAVGWGTRYNVAQIQAALMATTCVVRALDNGGATIGFARLFSDGKYHTNLAEVIVHPAWQGRGIGLAILGKARELFGHTAIYLETFRGQEAFFIKAGFCAKERMVVLSRRPDAGT